MKVTLFEEPYPAFREFVAALSGAGEALDLGCRQGRNTLLLAAYGYRVTGVDASEDDIQQMVDRATARGLGVTGVVEDLFTFDFAQMYDVIVLDAVLRFAQDTNREIDLLDRVLAHTRRQGHVFIFVDRVPAHQHALHRYLVTHMHGWELTRTEDVDHANGGNHRNVRAEPQMYMAVIQKK